MNISGLRRLNSVIKGNLNLLFLQGNFKRHYHLQFRCG